MPQAEWQRIFAEAERLAPNWPWKKVAPESIGPAPVAYAGYNVLSHEGWTVIVFQFGIEEQGFPKGSVGYDGAVRFNNTIVHCTREVAERLWHVAHQKVG